MNSMGITMQNQLSMGDKGVVTAIWPKYMVCDKARITNVQNKALF